MTGVILAAGDGTRLKSSSKESCCKPLTKIKNKHLITYSLDNLLRLNVAEAHIVIGKEGSLIKRSLGNEYCGIRLNYIYQQEQKGLTDAFVKALNTINDHKSVILQLSDEIFANLKDKEIRKMLKENNADFYCGITRESNPEKIKGNFRVETDNRRRLIKCIEKPDIITDDIKGTGFSIFNRKSVKLITDNADRLSDLCDCFNFLTDSGLTGITFTVADREFNINTATDLVEAEDCKEIG